MLAPADATHILFQMQFLDCRSKNWIEPLHRRYCPLFMEQTLDILERELETKIHQYRQADDFRIGFEVTKGATFCHTAKLIVPAACLKRISCDSALKVALITRFCPREGFSI